MGNNQNKQTNCVDEDQYSTETSTVQDEINQDFEMYKFQRSKKNQKSSKFTLKYCKSKYQNKSQKNKFGKYIKLCLKQMNHLDIEKLQEKLSEINFDLLTIKDLKNLILLSLLIKKTKSYQNYLTALKNEKFLCNKLFKTYYVLLKYRQLLNDPKWFCDAVLIFDGFLNIYKDLLKKF